jgi:drug/metabolite transporter (DMT)-like permease
MSPPSLLVRAKSAAARLPASTRGALWMIAGAGFMAGLTGMIRHASAGLHPFEVAFFRSLFGLMFMLPWLMRGGVLRLRTQRLGLYTVRALVGLLAMLCWFYALSLTPLADAVALSFTSPLFATVGAALVLREDVRVRRWTAAGAGFLGAMLMLRPGFGSVHLLPAVLVLVSAAALAGTALMIKELSRTEPANAIVIYMTLFMTPLTLGPALFVWRMPSGDQLLWLAALAAVATLGNLSVTRAFAAAEASAVVPYDFVRLPVAALIGFVAFAEVPDLWTWIGAAVIAGSSVYIARREARLERAGRRPDRAGGSAPSPGAGGP